MSVNLDRLADALTPDLLQPYQLPRRPIALGSLASLFLRPGYAQRPRSNPVFPAGPEHDRTGCSSGPARRLAERLASIIPGGVVTVASAQDGRPSAGAESLRSAVLLSDCQLHHVADPVALLRRLVNDLREVPILVVSVPLREYTDQVDDAGPPANPVHLREWAFPEIHALLDAVGLDVVFGGLAPGGLAPGGRQGSAQPLAILIAVGATG